MGKYTRVGAGLISLPAEGKLRISASRDTHVSY